MLIADYAHAPLKMCFHHPLFFIYLIPSLSFLPVQRREINISTNDAYCITDPWLLPFVVVDYWPALCCQCTLSLSAWGGIKKSSHLLFFNCSRNTARITLLFKKKKKKGILNPSHFGTVILELGIRLIPTTQVQSLMISFLTSFSFHVTDLPTPGVT